MNTFQQNKGIVAACAVMSLVLGVSFVNATKSMPKSTAPKSSTNRAGAVIACQANLERSLRDPSSVRYDHDLTQYAFKNDIHSVTLVYNAKNAFGGYVGQDVHVCTFNN